MSLSLLNIGMLLGLVAVVVPIVVHLLNRRRFDVVQWGAMQFLELGDRTRQRIKLSDLFLLLMRMAMVAMLAFAFSRPFVQGNTWIRGFYPEPVDLVIIIDGSYSMGWTGENITPHARAIQACHEILDGLTSVDKVAIIDARQRPHLLTPSPLTDTATARLELDTIEQPDGPANLVQALNKACQLLTQSYSPRRDILVLTDKQKLSWDFVNEKAWNQMLQIRKAAAVPINISAMDVGTQQMQLSENYLIEQLQASRELMVIDAPVTVTSAVKYTGQLEETTCEVFWSVDGQQLSRETETVRLRNGEQAVVQFTTRFTEAGPHIITASVSPDSLPGDDLSQISLQVLDSIPALIVTREKVPVEANQTPDRDADYFLRLAFGDPDQEKVWVDSSVVSYEQLQKQNLSQTRVLFLIATAELAFDVEDESRAPFWDQLTDFLVQGGTVFFIPDGDITQEDLQKITSQWKEQEQLVLPALFGSLVNTKDQESAEMFDLSSFSAPWLQRFRESKTSDLADILVTEYWKMTPAEAPKNNKADSNESTSLLSTVTTDGRLLSNDPLFLRRYVGRGQVVVSAISFDGIGNDLIRQRAFVPFLHELVMGLSETSSSRNVELNRPLIVRSLPCQPLKIKVTGPEDTLLYAQRTGSKNRIQWTLPPPMLSGIYTFQPGCTVLNQAKQQVPLEIPMSVFAPRNESNLTRLNEVDCDELEKTHQLHWQKNSKQMLASIAVASGGIEIWPLFLLLFIAMLVIELLMTKRLVQGGHHQIDIVPDASPTE